MLPTHVALVRSEEKVVGIDELLHVAATLQLQLARDFEPVWKIPVVLSVFTSLEQVPPGCLPLIVLPSGSLGGTGDHAFHTTEKGTPIALVEKNPGWSRAASHELLEMVCDPQGKRKVIGDSLADLHPTNVAAGNAAFVPQGQVAYLLEICDPCQDQPYSLNGLEVSDFVLPRYYTGGTTECGCYSFAGNVKAPLDLCPGGYVTWYTSFDKSPVWQAKKDASNTLRIGPMTIPAPGSSRSDVDFTNEVFDSLGTAAPAGTTPTPTAVAPEELAKRSARRYGEQLDADMKRVLADVSSDPPQDDFDKVLSIVERLINDKAYYSKFSTDMTYRSDELTKLLGHDIKFPQGVPSVDQLKAVYDKVQHVRGTGRKVSRKLAALMVQGQT
jgi:hypothetical protein